MRLFILFVLFTIPQAFAFPKDLIHSASLSFNSINSESELQDMDQNPVLRFTPNVSTGTGISVETEYFGLAYLFAGKEAQIKDFEKTKYQDIRLNFHLRHFDFRLMYQKYKGALVQAGGKSKFYKDYEVKSQNGRIHYYLNSDHLNYIRDGRKLVNKAISNQGFNPSASWFFGINMDSRSIELPENLEPEHITIINNKNINYDRSFSAFSMGPLVGYDWMLQLSSAYLRGKLAAGPAFQTGGGTVSQFELALNAGMAFKKNHLISLGMDIYILSFKDSDQRISNNNNQVALTYTYAFN